ncbi:MAG: hypothetical protein VKJ64_09410 [Leptolyngbyaceae bacterium]|nr:hypothetical protein [Leptolyngbyaceae bacterium]
MDANFQDTLATLKRLIQQLSVSDRWMLLKWLIELLQQEPQANQPEHTKVNVEAVHQICDEFRKLPVLDNRSAEEMIGYDQFGGLEQRSLIPPLSSPLLMGNLKHKLF